MEQHFVEIAENGRVTAEGVGMGKILSVYFVLEIKKMFRNFKTKISIFCIIMLLIGIIIKPFTEEITTNFLKRIF